MSFPQIALSWRHASRMRTSMISTCYFLLLIRCSAWLQVELLKWSLHPSWGILLIRLTLCVVALTAHSGSNRHSQQSNRWQIMGWSRPKRIRWKRPTYVACHYCSRWRACSKALLSWTPWRDVPRRQWFPMQVIEDIVRIGLGRAVLNVTLIAKTLIAERRIEMWDKILSKTSPT